ncbi:hypothetical protein A2U01_0061494, partial [Trifolium medium]|nr:hypothetical protein [Trifolium medium]
SNVDDPPAAPSRDPTMVSKPMVRPTSCIESLPDKGGQAAGPDEHNNGGTSTSVCG